LLRLSLIVLSLATVPVVALADVAGAVNEARLHSCYGSHDPAYRLRESPKLDAAARRLARGESLQNAAREAGYRAVTSASVQISNVPDDRDVERIVTQRFGKQICEPGLQDIGTYRRGQDVWLLVAAPFSPPAPRDRPEISRRVLELTNEVRSHARRCGWESFPAVPPLVLAPQLDTAAIEHSKDMALHDYMDHTGRDGSTPADRVTRTGYQWRTIGENLASGIMTPEEVVKGWVGSPHHCENLMSARFTQMAVAYAVNPSSSGGIFWTQVFGTPR
jgi:uncharacterized protein YkwD